MLGTIGIIIGSLLALFVGWVSWRIVATVLASQRRTELVLAEIARVTDALDRGVEPSAEDVQRYASHPRTRNVLLEALQEHGREELFPRQYATAEAMAESDLCLWLCHPNELQSSPDEIELIGRFSRTLEPSTLGGTYYLFRFRVKEPHWAADEGWMAGVAGPHIEGEQPAPTARGTFSQLDPYESRSPDDHVDVVHRLMVAKGVYADLTDEAGGD